jgi:hypothetical protein
MRPRHRIPTNEFGIESVEAGVDWITHIAERKSDVEFVEALAEEVGREDAASGSKKRPFSFCGYKGWHHARVRLGHSYGRALIQSSGSAAGYIATRLRSSSGRTTRLDVQATIGLSSSHLRFAKRSISLCSDTPNRKSASLIRRGFSEDSTGLAIGTVGRRTNPRYLRVYDKGVEKGTATPGTLWRLELEAKYGLAEVLWQQYRTTEETAPWCYGSLEAQWKSSASRWLLPKSSDPLSAARSPKREPAPAVALAGWLRTTVAPTIPRLLTVYSVEEVLGLLGMSDMAMSREKTDE